jgi:hypothetical protein
MLFIPLQMNSSQNLLIILNVPIWPPSGDIVLEEHWWLQAHDIHQFLVREQLQEQRRWNVCLIVGLPKSTIRKIYGWIIANFNFSKVASCNSPQVKLTPTSLSTLSSNDIYA